MNEARLRALEELRGRTVCNKSFQCAKSDYRVLCAARDIGLEHHLDCLDPNAGQCAMAMPFGDGYICRCPVRRFLAREAQG